MSRSLRIDVDTRRRERDRQQRWFAWLATYPETRGPEQIPNPDAWIHGETRDVTTKRKR